MNRYKVIGPRPVLDVDPGEELEAVFSADEEAEHITNRRLEIVPREYEVVGPREVHGAKPGEKFLASLTVGQEAALLEGGHIEVAGDDGGLEKRSREDLNVLARSTGVADPEKLPNKQAVIDAIETATEAKEGE